MKTFGDKVPGDTSFFPEFTVRTSRSGMAGSPATSSPGSSPVNSPSTPRNTLRKSQQPMGNADQPKPVSFIPPRLVYVNSNISVVADRKKDKITTKYRDVADISSGNRRSSVASKSSDRGFQTISSSPASIRNNVIPRPNKDQGSIGNSTQSTQDPRAFLDAVTSLVRTRTGSVLARNTILKMDHFPSGNGCIADSHRVGKA